MTVAVDWARRPMVLGALSLAVASALATFTNAAGSLVADARYEHYADPGQFLARHASIWDAERNLGEPSQYFSPVLATFQAGVQVVGAEPWVIQRLTHTLLLATAGIGMLLLVRYLFADGWVAIAAGFLYVFNPYTSQYLVPSGLFAAYAIAPWVVLCAVHGAGGRDPWRWAAGTAVAVGAMGMLNTPALLYALIPVLVITPFYISGKPSASWAALGRWGWRAVLLTAGVSAATVVVLALASPELRFNVQTTETPLASAAKSSASESWRGLGFWLSYFPSAVGSLRDQATPYFDNPAVIAATFAAPLLAALALVMRRTRLVAGLAVLVGTTVVVMVGIHPVDDPSPFGSALRWLFDQSSTARGFRSTYKAGVGLQLGLAALGGLALVSLARAARSARGRARTAGAAVVSAALVGGLVWAAFPFWSDSLYDGDERMEQLPDYWAEAFSWFDSQNDADGVLVLPSGARTRYRWGYVNDTLFDAHLPQPAVAAQTLPQSTALLADLTESVDGYVSTGRYESGVLGPWLRRMGVRWVLIQNDVDWERSGRPRPSTYDGIRTDPDFSLAAVFGDPGLNVVPPTGLAPGDESERLLAPVEVYEVGAPRPAGGIVSDGGVLVAGGGEAWPGLARAGWLDWPVTYTAELSAEELGMALDQAVAVVVTDGAQRRATVGEGQNVSRSHVLSIDESTFRRPQPLFSDPDDQTIAVYSDIVLVEASSFGPAFLPWPADARPANALDGDPATAWMAARRVDDQPVLRVDLAESTDIRSLTAVPYAASPDDARVSGFHVELTTEDGQVVVAETSVGDGAAAVEVPIEAARARSVEVRLMVDGAAQGSLVGISELQIMTPDGEIDGREFLRVPTLGPGEASGSLFDDVPVHYQFSRSPMGAPGAEQSDIRRVFWSPGQEDLDVGAEVRVDETTSDLVIDRLIGAEVGAFSTARFADEVEATATSVLDENLSTAWQFEAAEPPELTVRLGGQTVDEVEIRSILVGALPLRLSRVTELEVEVRGSDGSSVAGVSLPAEPTCDEAFRELDETLCIERVTVDLDPIVAEEIVVRPLEVDESSGPLGRLPVQVEGVQVRHEGVDLVDAVSTRPDSSCRALLDLDGVPVMMRPLEEPNLAALGAGLEFESCEPIAIAPGSHRLANASGLSNSVSWVTIDPATGPLPSPRTRALTTSTGDATSRRVTATVEEGQLIVTDVPVHDGWKLRAEGVSGYETSADGFVAWRATGTGDVELTIDFAPQRIYKLASVVSASTLVLCLWLLIPRRRRR